MTYLKLMEWIFILVTLFGLSLFSHLRAYARAIVEAVEENIATDKEI